MRVLDKMCRWGKCVGRNVSHRTNKIFKQFFVKAKHCPFVIIISFCFNKKNHDFFLRALALFSLSYNTMENFTFASGATSILLGGFII